MSIIGAQRNYRYPMRCPNWQIHDSGIGLNGSSINFNFVIPECFSLVYYTISCYPMLSCYTCVIMNNVVVENKGIPNPEKALPDIFFSWQCNIDSCEISVIILDISSAQLNTTTVSGQLNICCDEDAIFPWGSIIIHNCHWYLITTISEKYRSDY